MAEYIKREDAAEKVIANILYEEPPYTDPCSAINRWVADQMEDVPSIDIVHCKDCKYSIEVKESDSIICRHPSQHPTYERTSDDYCSYGKRKEQEHEFFKK